jgi:hypothetical protein
VDGTQSCAELIGGDESHSRLGWMSSAVYARGWRYATLRRRLRSADRRHHRRL